MNLGVGGKVWGRKHGRSGRNSAGIRQWKAQEAQMLRELRIETVLIAECRAGSLEIRMFNWISLGMTHRL